MINFLIDLFTALRYSFAKSGKERQLAGAAAGIIVLSLIFAGFTSWVSMPQYANILHGLSEAMAWTLSIGIAAVLFYALSLAAYLCYQYMEHKEKLPEYFAFLCIVIICLAGFDGYKNFQGSTDRAEIATVYNQYLEEGATLPFSSEIQALQDEKQAIYDRYTYKGKTYFAKTKYHPEFPQDRARMNQIEIKLAGLEDAQTAAIDTRTEAVKEENQKNDLKEVSSEQGLQVLSIAVYLIQFVLAFCSVAILDALGRDKESTDLDKPDTLSDIDSKALPDPEPDENLNLVPEIGFKRIGQRQNTGRQGVRYLGGDNPEIEELRRKIDELEKERKQGSTVDQIGSILNTLDQLKASIAQGSFNGSMNRSGSQHDRTFLHSNFDERDAQESRQIRTEKAMKLRDSAIQLRQEGKTISEIAKLINRSESSVKRYLK